MKDIIVNNNSKPFICNVVDKGQVLEENGHSFSNIITDSISDVNRLQKEADMAVQKMTTGEEIDIHNTMIAMEKADISFRLVMQVRNKIISAYEEVMRMQV